MVDDELYRTLAIKVAREVLQELNGMKGHLLSEVLESLEEGDDVNDELIAMVIYPFMDRFIDEILKHEEE